MSLPMILTIMIITIMALIMAMAGTSVSASAGTGEALASAGMMVISMIIMAVAALAAFIIIPIIMDTGIGPGGEENGLETTIAIGIIIPDTDLSAFRQTFGSATGTTGHIEEAVSTLETTLKAIQGTA